jgi:PLD-like domain
LHTTFEAQKDRSHAPGETYSHGVRDCHRDLPNRVGLGHVCKVIVIDGELVITGSFNFTKAAQQDNAENVLMIRDAAIGLPGMVSLENHVAQVMDLTLLVALTARVESAKA